MILMVDQLWHWGPSLGSPGLWISCCDGSVCMLLKKAGEGNYLIGFMVTRPTVPVPHVTLPKTQSLTPCSPVTCTCSCTM